ncbi:MAG: hypothetical protein M1835_007032 [Candelina submexicana]|nr:MAG: hypothetical protein M1835_007032 [Candelina submexicana]
MPSSPTIDDILTHQQKKDANREATKYLGNNSHPTQNWRDMGFDLKLKTVNGFIKHLEETDNTSIANALKGQECVFDFIRTRRKATRNIKRSKTAKDNAPDKEGIRSESSSADTDSNMTHTESAAGVS